MQKFRDILALGFGVVVAILLAEIIVRCFVYIPTISSTPLPNVLAHQATENLRLLYKPVPNTSVTAYNRSVEFNSLGFRDKEYAISPPPQKKRIIFLGDSVVFGLGVGRDDTIPKQLEKSFEDSQMKIEVLNLGVLGYESSQEIEFFKETGLQLDPDLVLIGFTLNDTIYGSSEMGLLHDYYDPTVQIPYPEWHKRFYAFLFKHSRLAAYLDYRFQLQKRFKHFQASRKQSIWFWIEERNQKIQDPPESPYQQLKFKILETAEQKQTSPENLKKMLGFIGIDNPPFYSSHWDFSKKAFLELKELSQKHHFKVGIVLFPYMIDIEHYALDSVHQFLKDEFEQMGFFVIDTADYISESYKQYGLRIRKDPIHFSAFGCKLVAGFLSQKLKNEHII